MEKKILGISCFYHDSSATLLIGNKIVSAVQEERFTRKKNDSSFPNHAIKFILTKNQIKLNNIDAIVFYEKPFLKFNRILETTLAFIPYNFEQFLKSLPIWLKEKLFQKNVIFKELKKIDKNFNKIKKIKFSQHHLSHAASAFYPSPFNKSIILTLDGVGEWSTSTVAIGEGNKIFLKKEIKYPHSLGLLYSTFTSYCGFEVNEGEYKLMGLAPYGKPKYYNLIKDNIVDIAEDGSFKLNLKYFNFYKGMKMFDRELIKLFNYPPRKLNEDKIEQFYMDVASSIQKVTEDIILKICRSLAREYKIENLCLAGGVALNCVANGKIINENIFKNIWIQPASGDSGGSLGAALAYLMNENFSQKKKENSEDMMQGSLLGPEFTSDEILSELKKTQLKYEKIEDEKNLIYEAARIIAEDGVVAWFQGKLEFGPRALGNRSIIGDPRRPDMQEKINLKVKFRESFRPFAPAVLEEKVFEWFEFNKQSPYMLIVSQVKKNKLKIINSESFGLDKLKDKRSVIPAVTHVDNSARLQTVNKINNKKFYKLIKKFDEITGCPILINTSFNTRGMPIVCSPYDAIESFKKIGLNTLIIGNYIVRKK